MTSFLRVPAILLCSYQTGGFRRLFAAIKNCHFGAQICSCLIIASRYWQGGETGAGQPLEAERSGYESRSALGHSVLPPLWAAIFSSVQWLGGWGVGFRVAVTSAGSQPDT